MTSKTTIPTTPDRFETLVEAKERRARKVRILGQGGKGQRRLADKLKRCQKGRRCRSGACDVCLRLYRLRLLRQGSRVLAQREHWTRASVVPAGLLLCPGKLTKADLRALGEM